MTKHRPEGHPALTPYLTCRDAASAIDWYVRALGAERQGAPLLMPDGRVGHAELRFEDSTMFVADEFPEMDILGPATRGGPSVSLTLYVSDVDATFARAIDAGATEERPVADQFYGARTGWLVDPFGHRWSIQTHIEDVSDDELARRMQEAIEKG